jgi:putative tryptophan/tyrosine transport system substrate-binding protein
MKRREIMTLIGIAAAWPAVSRAQDRVRVIGILETISPGLNSANLNALRRGLRELGYTEGESIRLEYRSAEGQASRFPALAAELVRLKMELIVTRGMPAVGRPSRSVPKIGNAFSHWAVTSHGPGTEPAQALKRARKSFVC